MSYTLSLVLLGASAFDPMACELSYAALANGETQHLTVSASWYPPIAVAEIDGASWSEESAETAMLGLDAVAVVGEHREQIEADIARLMLETFPDQAKRRRRRTSDEQSAAGEA